ncbi:3-hydroxyisobutyrate dehydrogenase [Artomyces pyxidatus]|uniref:3-hydroxyisobutyrate dehydrogenase n=1 Tax=Artomyces pyxidatus TaxID=48021 RepID=A0ACB8T752_9AGAM|nr:3-hydroxyisobutyrate dehydrogenase [Artomyces pyxidatus]
MRATTRSLQQWDRYLSRGKSTSFIGLGRMGSEMAYNLFSKRYAEANDAHFVVCDAMPESATRFCENFLKQFPGAKMAIASTPEEAVLASSTVITMLPSSPHVRKVYSESGGLIPALRLLSETEAKATVCIDSTTLDVQVGRDVAAETRQTGAEMVDAPVSGGVTGAKAGTLSFLVGGTESAFRLTQPTLARMGQRIIYCGASGAGLAAKICNNLVLGVEQIVVAEAMLLGQRLGLNAAVLAGVINSSTGACWSSSVNNPVPGALPDRSPPSEREYEGGFATSLMIKDMGLATDVSQASGSPLPLAEAAGRIYQDAVRLHPELGKKDFSSVYQYLQRAAEEGRKTAYVCRACQCDPPFRAI